VTGLPAALATELLKSRRSRVPWGVAIGFSIAPLVMGLFMVILKDREAARALGLLGAKAQLTAGTADWPTYWSLLGQAVTVGGSILFAFLPAWVFGREFADRTVRGLLATATPRRTIVIAEARDRRADRPPRVVCFSAGPCARQSFPDGHLGYPDAQTPTPHVRRVGSGRR
jgi:hypothetical protein